MKYRRLNRALIRYTFITVSNIALFHKKHIAMTRIGSEGVPCLSDISEGEKAVFGRLKFKKLLGDTSLKITIVNLTFLRTEISLSYAL